MPATKETLLRLARRATRHRNDIPPEDRLLADWRELDAYVLLGDPGAGKSFAFEDESKACGGALITARNFITLGIEPSHKGKTLFIDALDEMRAGGGDGRAPLDAIRARLNELGRPRFRLSCREADWRSQADVNALRDVAPKGEVTELHLEPLTRAEVFEVLRSRPVQVPDPDAFWRRGETHGLTALFGNPLLLDLTIHAVASGWPDSRQGVYEQACRRLAEETSIEHLAAKPLAPGDIDKLLDDAGLLCALLLLSGRRAVARRASEDAQLVALPALPADLQFHDAAVALASKVFITQAGISTPRHRSIAEYLAAQALARRIVRDGLPLGRVLALMQGNDGGIVEPLRGLLAWLAVHNKRDRERLIRLDPLGVVLNGDVKAFSLSDKRALLDALRDEARRNPRFREQQWVSHPFGALASSDMTEAFEQVLRDPARDESHQALVDCVLDALHHGTPMPTLAPALESWIEDATAWFGVRLGAYVAWKRSKEFDAVKARDWLERTREGTLQDSDARLASALLTDLYPKVVGPSELLRYWPQVGDIGTSSVVPLFWSLSLFRQSRPDDYAALADTWVQVGPKLARRHGQFDLSRLRGQLLAAALEHSGDGISDERLHAWLGIGLDAHGSSKMEEVDKTAVAAWLTARPHRIKAVVLLGWRFTQPDDNGHRFFWTSEQRLHGAKPPRDWLTWLLEQAASTPNAGLAEYCFVRAARAVIDPPPGLDIPSMDDFETWANAHFEKWPRAHQWLEAAWSSPIQDWRGDDLRRQRKDEAQTSEERAKRKQDLAAHLNTIEAGTAVPQLLHQLALAHEGRFFDIHGDTPELRLQDFLVADESTAQKAVAALAGTFERDDMPSVDEILSLDSKGQYHYVRPAALLAARLQQAKDANAALAWPDDLASKLVAFYLTDGTGELPDWYRRLGEQRPRIVADLLIRYASPCLRRKGAVVTSGLRELAHEPSQAAVARLALPALLEGFPARASKSARAELNRSMLAALHLLDEHAAASLVRRKLEQPSLDAAQRICWLVADLPYHTDAAERLAAWVGKNERRAVALGIALNEQGSLGRSAGRMPTMALGRLIEVLAPITPREWRSGWVDDADKRGDSLRSLIATLASNPAQEAAAELRRLHETPRIGAWRTLVRDSMIGQQATAREAHYRYISPEAAALAIANRAPANTADLIAITLDHLRDLEKHLRGADTFLLRQFWPPRDGIPTPLDENAARDILLDKLRDRLLPLGVNVEREASAADDKRADMRVEYFVPATRIAVPIEVKRDSHAKLWLAWRDQLQRLYMIDPAAAGYGIYLVLWFGQSPRASPHGIKPSDAASLETMLRDSVPPIDRNHLNICVLDLSLPIRPDTRGRSRPPSKTHQAR